MYDLEDKFNKLADEVDKNAGLTRLTLFSPCKVRLTKFIACSIDSIDYVSICLFYFLNLLSLGCR